MQTAALEDYFTENSIPYIRALGHFEGHNEDSFIVFVRDCPIPEMLSLAGIFGQDSILVNCDDSTGMILSTNHEPTIYLGEAKFIGREDPRPDAYTILKDGTILTYGDK